MGWGIVHSVALAAAVIVGCVWLILTDRGGPLARAIAFGILVGIVVGVVLALNLTNQAWSSVADRLNVGIDPAWRILAVAAGISAIVGAVLGALVGLVRGGARSLVDGLVVGTLLGVIIGALTAITFGYQAGAGMGVLVGLLTIALLPATWLARDGIDTDAIQARFYPARTIASTKETLEWLQQQNPTGR